MTIIPIGWDNAGRPVATGIPHLDTLIDQLNAAKERGPFPTLNYVTEGNGYPPALTQYAAGIIALDNGSVVREHHTHLTWACVLPPGVDLVGLGDAAMIIGVQPGTVAKYLAASLPRGNPFPEATHRIGFARTRAWEPEAILRWEYDRPGPGWRSDRHQYGAEAADPPPPPAMSTWWIDVHARIAGVKSSTVRRIVQVTSVDLGTSRPTSTVSCLGMWQARVEDRWANLPGERRSRVRLDQWHYRMVPLDTGGGPS